MYKRAQILILDMPEATSALDNRTDKLEAINKLSPCGYYHHLIVAHRIATLRDCNRDIRG
jgi:ABC-type multidrug transport system fused ATPase/permease subunit